uniref:Nedd4 family interacting protein 1, like n=1 Tax=Cyprinus carpio carpio TaxID=630221 RepID=A0A8C1FG15_CYPCA
MAEPSGRYQQLPNEEEPEEGAQVASDPPPPYSSIAADNAAYFDYKDDAAFPKPPSYNVATSLPSYDEAERTKAEATVPLVSGRDDDFVARDDFEDADQLQIGNDGIFMLTCFMAFLFNWIGFFLSFCLTTSSNGFSSYGSLLISLLTLMDSTGYGGCFWHLASCSSSEALLTMLRSEKCQTPFLLFHGPEFSSSIKVTCWK